MAKHAGVLRYVRNFGYSRELFELLGINGSFVSP